MTRYRVKIVREAEEDLAELIDYISNHDSIERADYVLERLLVACERLEQYPERGHFLPELRSLGIRNYREVHLKPYRIIYEVIGREVFIQLIVDGRRSLQAILERRLLR
ncbi:MAG: type II toxin-antitoxin system RelE/ParE family toxin [Gammaproteobacteria bacterium]|nr:type II toxin-antitoxin system RelE/ParE family toxin [Gammaproteobacteria bacterium]